jgi:hypothetical protein
LQQQNSHAPILKPLHCLPESIIDITITTTIPFGFQSIADTSIRLPHHLGGEQGGLASIFLL